MRLPMPDLPKPSDLIALLLAIAIKVAMCLLSN